MTVTASSSRSDYLGDGVQTSFPIGFQVLRAEDLAVYITDPADLSNPVKLSLNSDYTVAGDPSSGTGTVVTVTAPAPLQAVAILRSITISQETSYEQYDNFPADSHERALDKLTMICQALHEQFTRAMMYPVGASASDILDSSEFLAACNAARAGSENAATAAGVSAAQSLGSATAAAISAAQAQAGDGGIRITTNDTTKAPLDTKLVDGDGLLFSVADPGGDERLQVSLALATTGGLELESGLAQVKIPEDSGLVLSASGLSLDTTLVPTNAALRPLIVAARLITQPLCGGA